MRLQGAHAEVTGYHCASGCLGVACLLLCFRARRHAWFAIGFPFMRQSTVPALCFWTIPRFLVSSSHLLLRSTRNSFFWETTSCVPVFIAVLGSQWIGSQWIHGLRESRRIFARIFPRFLREGRRRILKFTLSHFLSSWRRVHSKCFSCLLPIRFMALAF